MYEDLFSRVCGNKQLPVTKQINSLTIGPYSIVPIVGGGRRDLIRINKRERETNN